MESPRRKHFADFGLFVKFLQVTVPQTQQLDLVFHFAVAVFPTLAKVGDLVLLGQNLLTLLKNKGFELANALDLVVLGELGLVDGVRAVAGLESQLLLHVGQLIEQLPLAFLKLFYFLGQVLAGAV